MPHLDLSRFHTYDELTAYLHEVVTHHPRLARLDSIGRTREGRDLWVMTLTNTDTGPDLEKPGYWIDANIHAGEVTGGAAALYTIDHLTNGYGTDPQATRILDRLAVYVAPRLSPDGTEAYLTTPRLLRSNTTPYPFTDERDGLTPEDVDGNGLILEMRVPDPKGAWKISERDPRLMRPRGPFDLDGTFYHRYVEGRVRGHDGYTVSDAPPRYGLDLNRNFPQGWAPESQQRGAGPFPLSEPETRAVADFLTAHPNVNGVQSYHTFSGVILRPSSSQPDDALPTHDLDVYRRLGQRGTDLTGYPHTSVYHGFRYDPKTVLSGGFFDWLYDGLGIFAFANELWDVIGEAGVGKRDFIGWFRDHPEEDDLKILAFNDAHALGGFHDWTPFEHPELGKVEIGGWDTKRFWQNAPAAFLPDIARRHTLFTLDHAETAPRLNVRTLDAVRIGGNHDGHKIFQVSAVVENLGYLPTYTSARARERGVVPPIRVTLDLPQGASLVQGERSRDVGHLEGRSARPLLFAGAGGATNQETLVRWVVRAPLGTDVTVTAVSTRAGTTRATVRLA
ncbi:M14 family metallopeptidase [Deinococcus pimensis]|uniref:M14 family metallopeptidase n=1 Tax=Deinococcus pimensis TaxID=309888 RepID=UPI0004880337|nr:M14 family metallopeptidase [Deinococcus pimensis]